MNAIASLPQNAKLTSKKSAPVLGTPMKWEIMVLTQPKRAPWLAECLLRLLPQIAWPDVMVRVQTHDENLPIGTNRQKMLEQSNGQYVNFVDDDDLVSQDYAVSIYPHLGSVDVVTFPMAIRTAHGLEKEYAVFEPLGLNEPPRDWGWCRDILHLSPLRRQIATAFPMEGGIKEDVRWATKIRNAKLIQTQAMLGHPLYTYYPGGSRTPRPAPDDGPKKKLFHWQQDNGEKL